MSPVHILPLDAGLAEPELLAKGVHASHTLLQVAAGPDVSDEGHAVRLRFIRTGRNTEMTPVGGAEQSGVSYAESDGGVRSKEHYRRRRSWHWSVNRPPASKDSAATDLTLEEVSYERLNVFDVFSQRYEWGAILMTTSLSGSTWRQPSVERKRKTEPALRLIRPSKSEQLL